MKKIMDEIEARVEDDNEAAKKGNFDFDQNKRGEK